MTEHADDFEERLKQAVRELKSPEPSDAHLGRILEDRKQGHRVTLVTDTRHGRPLVVLGVAAAAAVILWIVPGPRDETSEASHSSPVSEFAIGMGLWPDQLYAQAATSATLPPIPPRDGSRLTAGRWVYSIQTLDEDGRVSEEHLRPIGIAQGSYQGSPAWLFFRQLRSANPAGQVDTVWLSRDSLHPLARYAPLRYGASLSTTYTGDSIVETWRKFNGEVDRKAAALPSPRLWETAVVLVENELPTLFMTTPLNSRWQGSYAGTAVNNDRELVTFWLDLKVVGEERITVPAGTFDCWKVASMYDRDRSYLYWVDKTTGWIIREGLEPAGVFARVLVSHAAN